LAGDSLSFNLPMKSGYQAHSQVDLNHFIGIMVEFQEEMVDAPDLLTSGSGTFLSQTDTTGFSRCDGFIVDPPPHNRAYFEDQLLAIDHYFQNVSGGSVGFTREVIDQVYRLPAGMRDYAQADTSLGRLFTEAVELASSELSQIYTPNSIIVVFHAGIGQDFSIPFLDPTPYDIKSAFVDDELLAGIIPAEINGYTINRGILLPETQNHIFYDVIEEIFYGETDFCDYQLGLTGTFALMLGYALGLPPLYNTETGDPGVGVFGLMDHGSNNGRGVIPAPPTAWSRIQMGWDTPEEIYSDGFLTISTENPIGQIHDIHKIGISNREYFLIENRNNWIVAQKSIERLRNEYPISEFRAGHWFDTLLDWMNGSQITISEITGVIVGFDHYDYGLPGSGLLIWHITEPEPDFYSMGINNDRDHRAIHLEEADGSVDIGFESYAVFESDNPTLGKLFDMWYAGNSGYAFANPNEPDEPRLRFGMDTEPDTRSSSRGETYIECSEISEQGLKMSYRLTHIDPFPAVVLSNTDIKIVGGGVNYNAYSGYLYYLSGDSVFVRNEDGVSSAYYPGWMGKVLFNSICSPDTVMISETQYDHMWLDDNCQIQFEDHLYPKGFLTVEDGSNSLPTELISVQDAVALGDIDNDGLDEIILIRDGDILVNNYSGAPVNGFPVTGNFTGHVLVSNVTGDDLPEIICRENDNIVVLSSTGSRLFTIASRQPEQDLLMIHYWNDSQMALVDGAKVWLFPVDLDHSYWLFPHGTGNNSATVSGYHFLPNIPQIAIDTKRVYNYPNPITGGLTSFRYFVGESNSVEIRIYDASGFLIQKLENDNLTHGEYNETQWIPGRLNPGVYLAEIRPDNGKSALVQVVFLK